MLETIDLIYLLGFLGTFIEGEMALIFLSLYCQSKKYSYIGLLFITWMGSALWDQGLFFLTRFYLKNNNFILSLEKSDLFLKMNDFLSNNTKLFILFFRFIPGMRTIGPVLLARSRVSSSLYMKLNLLSSLLWAGSVSGLMFFLGKTYGHYILTSFSVVIFLVLLLKILLFFFKGN